MRPTKDMSYQLTAWQARQAAMLYHFSSIDYLRGLHKLVTDFIDGVIDPALDSAASQGRDAVLVDARWGDRNTSQNWANNAWPMLKGLQASLAKDISLRAFGTFCITSVGSILRGVDQYSLAWATNREGEEYETAMAAISKYATLIDITLDNYPIARWNDFAFAAAFPEFESECPRIPMFRVDRNIIVATGRIPDRTGVYISADDPNAALQFVWSGQHPCPLRSAATFNALGLHALSVVGRDNLWFDKEAMLQFASRPEYRGMFEDEVLFDGRLEAELAPGAVSIEAFTDQPSQWHLVEIIAEDGEDTQLIRAPKSIGASVIRLNGGDLCQAGGFYFSPAQPQSRRRFELGDEMPRFRSDY